MSTGARLAELQTAFTRYLLAGDNESALAARARDASGVPTERRLDVYRNAYFIRLEDALAHDFPALLAVVGCERFGHVSADYVRSRPSTSPSLRDFGRRLADWLRAERGEPALADLAALEWAVLHAFDAADAPTLTAEDLVAVPAGRWPELRVALHPSVTLVPAYANVREVWAAVDRSAPVPPLRASAEHLVVARSKGGKPSVDAIRAPWFELLGHMQRGVSVGDACAALVATMPSGDLPALVAEALHHAIARGWISSKGARRCQSC